MKQRLLLLLFAALTLLPLHAYDFQVDGIFYDITGSSTCAVTSDDNKYSGNVAIPSSVTYNGTTYSVTSIGESAFSWCTRLTSVIIPNSVTSIGHYAFDGCSGLTKAEFASIEHLCSINFGGYNANPLYYAHRLYIDGEEVTEVTIPNSVTSIGHSAFRGCSRLTSVTIPNSVTSIGSSAFESCSGLTSVTIPNSVTSIGDEAFSGCSGLTSVTIGNSVTKIGDEAFFECSGLTSITIPNSVTSIGKSAFCYCFGLISVTIGNSVTSIGKYAFWRCSGLTSVTIPNSVTEIGDEAFRGCSGLTSITIPNSVTQIGDGAFYDCSGLTDINVDSGSSNYASISGVLFSKNLQELIAYPAGKGEKEKTYTIPNSVTSIGKSAFYGCSGLTSITIPNSVTEIGTWAFSRCSGLTSVTIPNSITEIGNYAFSRCSGLTDINVDSGNSKYASISGVLFSKNLKELIAYPAGKGEKEKTYTIPNSVTSIGKSAFSNCSGLTSITIPNSITYIGIDAFGGVDSIERLLCLSPTPPELGSTWGFTENVYQNTPLCVPMGSVDSYKSAEGWKRFEIILGIEELDKPGQLINKVDIENIDNIKRIKISGPMNGTDLLTLNKMKNLEWLDLSDATIVSGGMNYYEEDNQKYGTTNNTLGNYWAYALNSLKTVYLPENLILIGNNAFQNKSKIAKLTIPNSVTAIGNYAFSGCSGLTSLEIPASVIGIGNGAFSGCTGLANLTLEDGETPLFAGSDILANCPLESLHLGRNLEFETSPFREKKTLNRLTIGNRVTSIKWGAFYRCGLTSVEIPNSVTKMGNYAFGECSGLTSVILPMSLTEINLGMFNQCSKLTSVTIPGGVRYIRSIAFKGCSALKTVNMINPIPAVISEDSFDFKGTLNVPAESKVYYWLHPLWSKFPNLQTWNVGSDVDFAIEDGNSTTYHITSEESATVEVTAATLLSRAAGELTIPETVTFNGKVYTVAGIANNAFTNMGFESIELPATISYVGLNAFSGCRELKTLRVNALLPPSAARESFDDTVFANATLIINENALEAYESHDVWKLFNTINNSSIEEIEASPEGGEVEVYNLRGVKVGETTDGLPHGVYIIRQGGSVKKVAI